MRKICIASLVIFINSFFFSASAISQNLPLACQSEASGGLRWEEGRWVTKTFSDSRFILVQTKDGLTTESVKKAISALGYGGLGVLCRADYQGLIVCSSSHGDSLLFSVHTLKGAISTLFGVTQSTGAVRERLSVTAFSCTPF